MERTIYYGGRVVGETGSEDVGTFYINGKTSPLGRRADAELGWDESARSEYGQTEAEGVFEIPISSDDNERCQPFLIRFDTEVKHAGKCIRSDDLYFELGDVPFPLKSNTIRGLGFCPMGPGETEMFLQQVRASDDDCFPEDRDVQIPDVELDRSKVKPFKPKYGVPELKRDHLTNEDHLEASVIANPTLLPPELAPNDGESIVRQAPISPLKPMQNDEIDLAYYDDEFADGLYPNKVLELKYTRADPNGRDDAEQIGRYREALDKMAEHYLSVEPDDIIVGMLAPRYDEDHFESRLDQSLIDRIVFRQFDKQPEKPGFTTSLDDF